MDAYAHRLHHSGRIVIQPVVYLVRLVGLSNGETSLDLSEDIIYKEATVIGVTGREMYGIKSIFPGFPENMSLNASS